MTDPNVPEPADDGGTHPVLPWLNQRRRAWLYRITTPVTALLTAYGIVDGNKAALWAGLATALIGTGTAVVNTSTSA